MKTLTKIIHYNGYTIKTTVIIDIEKYGNTGQYWHKVETTVENYGISQKTLSSLLVERIKNQQQKAKKYIDQNFNYAETTLREMGFN